ncbi:hypothetical protein ACS0TY_029529 [Phlomoides rotata]
MRILVRIRWNPTESARIRLQSLEIQNRSFRITHFQFSLILFFRYRSLCDQLAAIGHPIDETDKTYWFLRGLGSAFASFSVVMIAQRPLPRFTDLLP